MNYGDIIFLIGRILFGGYFLLMAWNHFTKVGALAGYAQSKGVPMPQAAVLVGGVLLLAGGLGILLGAYVEWAVLALVLFLVPVSFAMHNFWAVADPTMKMADMINFQKNMALLGAALMMLSVSTPWPFAVLFW